MATRFILSPYYYGDPLAGLDHLATRAWERNQVDLAPPLPDPSPQQMMARMIAVYKPLADWFETTIRAGDLPISLSGDCSSSMAMLTGVQNAGIDPLFIWFDSHGDFNTWETTPSGYLRGMPLAIVSGRGEQMVPRGLGFNNIPDEQIILTDARELDPGEVSNLADSTITHLTDVALLLDHDLGHRPIAVHFDVDIINGQEAPAMEFPTEGGPSAAMMGRVFARIADTGRLTAVSVSSWVPSLDTEGVTADVVLQLLSILGSQGGQALENQ